MLIKKINIKLRIKSIFLALERQAQLLIVRTMKKKKRRKDYKSVYNMFPFMIVQRDNIRKGENIKGGERMRTTCSTINSTLTLLTHTQTHKHTQYQE